MSASPITWCTSIALATDHFSIRINGAGHEVREGVTVFAAIQRAGVTLCRRSVTGEPRNGICGMGICFECRVTIDGVQHQRACMTPCRAGMEIATDA